MRAEPRAREGQGVKTVILCGGMGTRMRDYSEVLPKPLVPIGGRPILWHLLKYFAHFGRTDFILCLGFKREAFVDYFLNYRYHNSDLTIELGRPEGVWLHDREFPSDNWRLTLADTGLRTNTGGRLKRVAKYLDGTRFLLTYGDGLANVDLEALLDCHRRSGKLATVTAVHPAGRFGEIELDEQGVCEFAEKPQTSAGYINGGFLVMEREFIHRYLTDDTKCVLEADALARCARDRQLAAYRHEGFWQCMDTPREQQLLEDLWTRGTAPWRVWQDSFNREPEASAWGARSPAGRG
jgi:glucose-1-phosphate cytidylyltransferase